MRADTYCKTPSVSERRVLVHEHHNPTHIFSLAQRLLDHAQTYRAANMPVSEAFKGDGVPDVYVVGYTNSQFIGLNTAAQEHYVRWVREHHPDVRVIGMQYDRHLPLMRQAGAHAVMDYADFYANNFDPLVDVIVAELNQSPRE